jgi:hypothetical protein
MCFLSRLGSICVHIPKSWLCWTVWQISLFLEKTRLIPFDCTGELLRLLTTKQYTKLYTLKRIMRINYDWYLCKVARILFFPVLLFLSIHFFFSVNIISSFSGLYDMVPQNNIKKKIVFRTYPFWKVITNILLTHFLLSTLLLPYRSVRLYNYYILLIIHSNIFFTLLLLLVV